AAEPEPPRLRREPERELDQVREDLVAFALEMMLRGPQSVVAEIVHQLGDVARREERLAQLGVVVAPGIGRGAPETDVLEVHLADPEHVEPLNHLAAHPPPTTSAEPVT